MPKFGDGGVNFCTEKEMVEVFGLKVSDYKTLGCSPKEPSPKGTTHSHSLKPIAACNAHPYPGEP